MNWGTSGHREEKVLLRGRSAGLGRLYFCPLREPSIREPSDMQPPLRRQAQSVQRWRLPQEECLVEQWEGVSESNQNPDLCRQLLEVTVSWWETSFSVLNFWPKRSKCLWIPLTCFGLFSMYFLDVINILDINVSQKKIKMFLNFK